MILLRVDDAVAEGCGRQVHLPRQIQQGFSLSRNARVSFCRGADNFVLLTRLSKAARERGMGFPSAHTSVNSVCPTAMRHDLPSHRI